MNGTKQGARVAGLILAAGAGRRFGGPIKQLARLDGRPLLQHAIDAHLAAPAIERVVVVLGANAEAIRHEIDVGRGEIVVCSGWWRGQSASLLTGARALDGAERIVCTLGDQPRISAAAIQMLAVQPEGARAGYAGRPGHPVVLAARELSALATLRGDTGARSLLRDVPIVEAGHLGSDADVDTPADLARLGLSGAPLPSRLGPDDWPVPVLAGARAASSQSEDEIAPIDGPIEFRRA